MAFMKTLLPFALILSSSAIADSNIEGSMLCTASSVDVLSVEGETPKKYTGFKGGLSYNDIVLFEYKYETLGDGVFFKISSPKGKETLKIRGAFLDDIKVFFKEKKEVRFFSVASSVIMSPTKIYIDALGQFRFSQLNGEDWVGAYTRFDTPIAQDTHLSSVETAAFVCKHSFNNKLNEILDVIEKKAIEKNKLVD